MSQHTQAEPQTTSRFAASSAGKQAEPGALPEWVHAPHSMQRIMEDFYSARELAHHLQHRGGLTPEVAPMVDGMKRGSAATAGTAVSTLGRVMGGLGIAGGALELYEGVHELQHGHWQQGSLDVGAGVAGIGVGGLALLGSSLAAPLAAPAAAVGAVALGNKTGAELELFGQDAQNHNRSAYDWVQDCTTSTYSDVQAALGGGVLGTVGGGAAAGVVGLGTGLGATLLNTSLGVLGAGMGIGKFIRHLTSANDTD